MISQKSGKTALVVLNFVSNISIVQFHVLSRRLVGNAFAMHPVSLEHRASQLTETQRNAPAPAPAPLNLIVSHNLRSDEHESERAFAAGSVLEKALSE